MKCPYCGCEDSKVIDSRPTDEGERIRRRRECTKCGKRFTTYEIIETVPLIVVKKDGTRESFDRVKLFNGLLRACEKRPVPIDEVAYVRFASVYRQFKDVSTFVDEVTKLLNEK